MGSPPPEGLGLRQTQCNGQIRSTCSEKMIKEEGDGYLELQQGTATGIKRPGYGRIWLRIQR